MERKKFDFKILIIIILLFVLIGIVVMYFSSDSNDYNMSQTQTDSIKSNSTTSETTISSKGEIYSALSEKKEFHATYYSEEIYVTENEFVKEGENILKYTNGEYLQAPYDCVIKTTNVPNEDEQCTNEHYIEIEATNQLAMNISIDESNINNVYLGQEATIKVTALENKEYKGNITNISSTATNGNFEVTVEFINDGKINLGMTGTCSIVL